MFETRVPGYPNVLCFVQACAYIKWSEKRFNSAISDWRDWTGESREEWGQSQFVIRIVLYSDIAIHRPQFSIRSLPAESENSFEPG